MCKENDVDAFLVPCGHYLFCYECANMAAMRYVVCPYCLDVALMAVRIK